jgi:hypothetical protein
VWGCLINNSLNFVDDDEESAKFVVAAIPELLGLGLAQHVFTHYGGRERRTFILLTCFAKEERGVI